MNFLGMGPLEIAIIMLLAFIFLGPERMMDAARQFGKLSRELRRMTSEVKNEIREIIPDENVIKEIIPSDILNEDKPKPPTTNSDADPNEVPAPSNDQSPANDDESDEPPSDEDGPVAFRSGQATTTKESDSESKPSIEERS